MIKFDTIKSVKGKNQLPDIGTNNLQIIEKEKDCEFPDDNFDK